LLPRDGSLRFILILARSLEAAGVVNQVREGGQKTNGLPFSIALIILLSGICRDEPPVLAAVALPPPSSATAGATITAIPNEPIILLGVGLRPRRGATEGLFDLAIEIAATITTHR
jgi:hypothetical protein